MEFTPKWIAWETTRRCNLHCIHCRSSSEQEANDHPDFSTAEAFRIIDDIASYAKPVIVLSGGEPLIRKDVFDIARYGADKGLRMCLATNGTLVNDETCDKIRTSGIRIVSLSLDGSEESVHDDFRNQKGAFEGTIKAARLFKEDYEEILEWHYQMEKDETDMLVRPTCAPHYYRIVLQKSKQEGVKYERRSLKFSTGGSKGCIAGQLICLIDVDGNVLPCSYFPKPAGNIKEQSFRDIWENSDLFKELRNFKMYKGKCGACEFIAVCGGCRARAYAMHGDYLEEEPFCGYMPKKLKQVDSRK